MTVISRDKACAAIGPHVQAVSEPVGSNLTKGVLCGIEASVER